MFTLFYPKNDKTIVICSVRSNRRFFSRSYCVSKFSIERVKRYQLTRSWSDNTGTLERYEAATLDSPRDRISREMSNKSD